MLTQAFGLLIDEVAVDMGSSMMRVYVRGRGLVVEEPAIVAIEERKGKNRVVAMGHEAKEMMGRTPEGIKTLYPIQRSKVIHPELAEKLLAKSLEKAMGGKPLLRPRMVVSRPHSLKGKDLETFQQVVRSVGSKDAYLVNSIVCCALGCELPIDEATGMMVVNIGMGTTQIGVLSLSNIAAASSVPIAGAYFDEAIIRWLREQQKVVIGAKTAEELKIGIGCASQPDPERRTQFRCRDVSGGAPREVNITSVDIHKALKAPMKQLLEAIRRIFTRLTPELAADLVENGVILCGGGSLLSGIADYLQSQIEVPVITMDNSRHIVTNGAGALLADSPYLHWISE